MTNKLGPYDLNSIITGDARELAKAIPDESVDLIFTDPVYDRIEDYEWLAEMAARVLKDGGNLLCWQGVKWIPQTINILNRNLDYRWTISLSHLNATVGTIKGCVYSHWTPCFWYSKSKTKPRIRFRDAKDISLVANKKENHQWHKSIEGIYYWTNCITLEDQIIFDPFAGGGTVPAVCKMLNRQYLAFEVDPETADLARQRVANTQPPLPIVWPEQMEMVI